MFDAMRMLSFSSGLTSAWDVELSLYGVPGIESVLGPAILVIGPVKLALEPALIPLAPDMFSLALGMLLAPMTSTLRSGLISFALVLDPMIFHLTRARD